MASYRIVSCRIHNGAINQHESELGLVLSSASLEPPRSTNLELGSIVDLSDHVEEQRSPHSLVLDEREGIGLERQEVERIERTEHGANVQVARGPQVLGHRGQDRAQLLRTREISMAGSVSIVRDTREREALDEPQRVRARRAMLRRARGSPCSGSSWPRRRCLPRDRIGSRSPRARR